MKFEQRLIRLEASLTPPAKPDWIAPIEAMADQDPAAFALWRIGYSRAMRRSLAATGQPPDWDAVEREAHVDAELDRLEAIGPGAWIAEADDLPVLLGWPSNRAEEADFWRRELDLASRAATDAHAHLVRLGFRS